MRYIVVTASFAVDAGKIKVSGNGTIVAVYCFICAVFRLLLSFFSSSATSFNSVFIIIAI